MNLPTVISDLVKAQQRLDSDALANCFSENALVFDEKQTHNGINEIREWNASTNTKYKTVLEPIRYEEEGNSSILTTKVSGTFPGSPIVLRYRFVIANGLIDQLRIID